MHTETHTQSRPPIVSIMGHIDHGKSTLLSYIRKSKKPLHEAGGITQHVSAYEVEHLGSDGKNHTITFLDTPGHEAFSGIRTRGAHVADIVVLVVSAEDGVKPQTTEAWKSIVASNTPFIVAITKIDKSEANIERVKQNLVEHEIYIEGYGGDIPVVALSSVTGKGVPELLDMITLVAEIENLTGDANTFASGEIIESNRDKTKGISATCIIKNGTIHKGMFVVAGTRSAPVRSIENYLGTHVDSATFSSPIVLTGWDELPEVGSTFQTFITREETKIAIETAIKKTPTEHTKIDDSTFRIPIIIKADAGGSLEAVVHEIEKLSNERVSTQIIFRGIGPVSENDIRIASGGQKALVIGFNTTVDSPAKSLALRNEVEIKTFDIIYKLTEWLQEKLVESTPKIKVEESTGLAKVIKIFSKTKDKQILGGKVERGSITLGSTVKIMRRDAEIGIGKVKELQEQKNRVSEVLEGKEFGTLIEAKIEIAPGDRIESFITIEK